MLGTDKSILKRQAGRGEAAMTLDFELIETPENVNLERRLAGIGSRFLAGLVDVLILAAIFIVLFLILLVGGLNLFSSSSGMKEEAAAWLIAVVAALVFIVYWGYYVFFEACFNGQSPGKRALRIRVVKQGGGPITFVDVAIRNLLRVVDCIGLYAVGGLAMFFSQKTQRLGDFAAGAGDTRALASGLRCAPPSGKGSVDSNYHFMTGTTRGGRSVELERHGHAAGLAPVSG
jgi:uncharacterized RDD family membrane protein YckC